MRPSEGWAEREGLLREARMAALGLRHGVTTRAMGNMKDEARRRAAAAALGLPEPLTLRQVHGATVRQAVEASRGVEGDGLLGGGRPDLAFGVYVADCVPLYLWSADGRVAGVFHAGWRGVAAGIARSAVESFRAALVPPADLAAAAGPHIGACCYAVGPEMEARFPPAAFVRRGAQLRLDLAAELRRQLVEAGVPPGRVDLAAPCTACDAGRFFSFRRDKQDSRMLALLATN